MKKKNKVTLLTNAELAIMQILWCSDRPLERSEVCAAAEKKVDTPVFNKNSFHVLINDLITKNMVVALDAAGFTNRNARRYAPTISRNEYFAWQIASTEHYNPEDIPSIISSLFKFSKIEDFDSIINKLDEFVKELKTENRSVKQPEEAQRAEVVAGSETSPSSAAAKE